MRAKKSVSLLLWFLEGFAITWNPFTMAIALAFGVVIQAVAKPKATPTKNAFFLLGTLMGFIISYVGDDKPFFRWHKIWWMPTGIVLAAIVGIPILWYVERNESLK